MQEQATRILQNPSTLSRELGPTSTLQQLEQARAELDKARRSEGELLAAIESAAAEVEAANATATRERSLAADAEKRLLKAREIHARTETKLSKAQAIAAEAERRAQLERKRAAEAENVADTRKRLVTTEAERSLREAHAIHEAKVNEARVMAAEAERRAQLERQNAAEAEAERKLALAALELERKARCVETRRADENQGMDCESPYQLWAEKALQFARDSLVNGSSNRTFVCEPAVVQKLVFTHDDNPACFHGHWTTTGKSDGNLEKIVRCATTAMRLKFGNADAHACIAFTYLFQKGIKCQFWQWPVCQHAHYLVIVGPDDNPTNPLAWVCDPWARSCCPVSELPQHLGGIFGSGLSLSTAFCRAVNMNEDDSICLAFVDKCVQIQSEQLDRGGIIELPNFAEISPLQQMQLLQQLPF